MDQILSLNETRASLNSTVSDLDSEASRSSVIIDVDETIQHSTAKPPAVSPKSMITIQI